MRRCLPAMLALLALGSAPAAAAPITVDAGWYQFGFGGVGSIGFPCPLCSTEPASSVPGDAPWTFSGPATITVQDLFDSGDVFEIFDGATSLGVSSPVAGLDHSCGEIIADCVADPAFSRLSVAVGGGAHSITIALVESPFDMGAAVFRVDSVPEPAAVLLVGAGVAGAAVKTRRRRV